MREVSRNLRGVCSTFAKKKSTQTKKMLDKDCSVKAIAERIKSGQARRIVVMCGAGISVSAGIPDFRTPGTGLYDNLQKYKLPRPEAIFELAYFHTNPMPFYDLARSLYPDNFKPTPGHMFVRLLQEKGLLLRCYTQNIDTLERAAGVEATKLVEAHGSFASAHCVKCRAEYGQAYVKEQIHSHRTCRCAACNGFVKPDIVFFGEDLPSRFFQHVDIDLPQADLLLVMGTSLKVYPFANIMHMTPGSTPRLLINYERVGKTDSTGLGFKFDRNDNCRDVELLSSIDDGVRLLCDLLGWRDELESLLTEVGGTALDPTVHPISVQDLRVTRNYRARLPELCPIIPSCARSAADGREDYFCTVDVESFLSLYRGLDSENMSVVATARPLQTADSLQATLRLPIFDPADGAENAYELRFEVDGMVVARFGPLLLSAGHLDEETARPQGAPSAVSTAQSPQHTSQQQTRQRTIPFISQLILYAGATDGQLSVFQGTDERLHLYRWSSVERTWQSMGVVDNPKKQEELDGTLYDQVIDIEIDSASMGFLELRLGFNEGDDPEEVAQRCCSANNLPDEYRPQIAEYIQMISNF